MNNDDYVIVYSKRIAIKLKTLGYTIDHIDLNNLNPNFFVYFFINEGNIHEDLQKYISESRRNKGSTQ